MITGPQEKLPPGFLNLNWDQTMDSSAAFDSALSSIVSSQASDSPAGIDSLAFHKLVGAMQNNGSNGGEYFSTPLSSPPKLHLSMLGHLSHQPAAMAGLPSLLGAHMPLPNLEQLAVDPGFAERAARFSSFDGRSYDQLASEYGLQNGRVSRAGSGKSIKMNAVPGILQSEVSNGIEESSVSDHAGGTSGNNSKKRKAPPAKSKGKLSNSTNSAVDNAKVVAEEESSDAKRIRNENGSVEPKVEQNESADGSGDGGQKQGKESNVKVSEPPKDYIHVRARRGQATDSHSLAERVRREKISQRMKLLQDLVPGCNKVTGKAVMLDEIINYVQSLQRQVEFLSMKLATVNPRLDFNNLASLFPKDMPQNCGPVQNSTFPETSGIASPYSNQQQQGTSLHCLMNNGIDMQSLLDPTFHQNPNVHQFASAFENAQSQLGSFWDDDLHSVIHMDLGQNSESVIASQSFHGSLPTVHMKTEF